MGIIPHCAYINAPYFCSFFIAVLLAPPPVQIPFENPFNIRGKIARKHGFKVKFVLINEDIKIPPPRARVHLMFATYL
jgi:hypothetical protein